jgi:hypothetical protein
MDGDTSIVFSSGSIAEPRAPRSPHRNGCSHIHVVLA